jgi:stage II sporulation protein D
MGRARTLAVLSALGLAIAVCAQGQPIRVLLQAWEGCAALEAACDGGVAVLDMRGATLAESGRGEAVAVKVSGEMVETGEQPIRARALYLAPRTGSLRLTGTDREAEYRGWVQVTARNGGLRLVNEVALESYLLGVVPAEMPSGFPLEALKAQAVAARTYAMRALAE